MALLAAALVLVLAVLAASPELHARLHSHGPAPAAQGGKDGSGAGRASDDEDGCVVTLFAQGLVLAIAFAAPALAGRALSPGSPNRPERVLPAAPRYLRLPSQAPPIGAR